MYHSIQILAYSISYRSVPVPVPDLVDIDGIPCLINDYRVTDYDAVMKGVILKNAVLRNRFDRNAPCLRAGNESCHKQGYEPKV